MPFTPYHLGPALLLGVLLRKYLDFPTFVIANLIVDVRVGLVFLGIVTGPLHGFLHTFLYSSVLGVLLGTLMYGLRNFTPKVLENKWMRGAEDPKKYLLAGGAGVWLHVLLDSFLYTDMLPFSPFEFNHFLGVITKQKLEIFCVICFILGSAYIISMSENDRK